MRKAADSVHDRVHSLVRQIPRGRVATYGQIAARVPGCTPRMAGYAMAGCPDDVPWQRVINSRGMISPRADGRPDARQRRILEAEGVVLDERGRIDLTTYGWFPPG